MDNVWSLLLKDRMFWAVSTLNYQKTDSGHDPRIFKYLVFEELCGCERE